MNDALNRLRATYEGLVSSWSIFFRTNRGFILSGATIIIIVLIVWARMGFSLETSRFFASEFSGTCTFAEKDLPECACGAMTRKDLCHVCTDSYKEGNTDYSDAQWTAWDNLNLCRPTCPARFPYETERTQMDGSSFTFPLYCVEKPPDCPDGFFASGDTKCEADAAPTPTPTPTPLVCPPIPAASSVRAASLGVQCGAGGNVLTWQNPLSLNAGVNSVLRVEQRLDGAVLQGRFIFEEGGCWNTFGINTFTDTSLTATSRYTYTIKTHPQVSSNDVVCVGSGFVQPTPTLSVTPTPTGSPQVTPTPIGTITPSPTLSATPTPDPMSLRILTTAKNASTGGADSNLVQVRGGQIVEVIMQVQNTSNSRILRNVSVRASLPSGFEYVIGSTTVGGTPTSIDSIVSSGLALGAFGAPQTNTVTFRARVNATGFNVGTTRVQIATTATADQVNSASAAVDVDVIIQGPGSSVATTQTGPGDAVLIALMISAVMSLLYVSYTQSSSYRRREVDIISANRDPMDFRG